MKLIRRPDVCARTGLSASTIDRLERAGRFPARRRIGAAAVGWIDDEVDAWIAAAPVRGSDINDTAVSGGQA